MSIFKEYFELNNHLPKELTKYVKILRELEENFNNEKNKVLNRPKNYKQKNISYSSIQSNEKELDKIISICNDKMDNANDAYYLLDSSIKKVTGIIENLEQELINTKFNDFSYQNSLLDKNFDELVNFESYLNNKKKSRSKKSRNALKNLNLNLNISINSLKKRKSKKILKLRKKNEKKANPSKPKTENFKTFISNNNLEDITHKEIDGKLGLREPIYCFCNYVSYGDMVKCDNPKCPREWFHFNCVGLTSFPTGKWYCSTKCASLKKK